MNREKPKRPRLSIMPARAVRDRNISAQALRVLALLGCHTDDEGWCTRSQVRMAEELGVSRGTIQNSLDELAGGGYVEKREENRRGVRPAPGRHPHCAYSYRVRLDLDDDAPGANRLAPMVPTGQQGVPTQEKHGVPISLAPLTERSLINGPLGNSSAPAAAGESGNVASLGVGEAERWPEFRSAVAKSWPDRFPPDDEVACRKQFERLTLKHPAELLMTCAGLHGAELGRRQHARGSKSKQIAKRPSNWLKDGDWQGYTEQAEEVARQEAETVSALGDVRRALGEGVFGMLRREGMPDNAVARLAGMTLTPPAAFTVTSAFQKTLLDRYTGALERHLGERPAFTLVQLVRRAS